MKAFSALFAALDNDTSTLAKRRALLDYLQKSSAEDAAWAVYFLAGGKPRQLAPTRLLRQLAQQLAGLPEWLFDEAYHSVGDLAETIAHILPPATRLSEHSLSFWIEKRLFPLRGKDAVYIAEKLSSYWAELDWNGRFLLNKLISGSFRVGVSRQLIVRALSDLSQVDHLKISQRIVGYTDSKRAPNAERYLKLISEKPNQLNQTANPETIETSQPANANLFETGQFLVSNSSSIKNSDDDDHGLPYPFFLAHALDNQADVTTLLGDAKNWLAEWKWDGIRAQLIKRAEKVWLWSRGEDLLTDRFPEIVATAAGLPNGTVIDGEILAWDALQHKPYTFSKLQPRITRKTITANILKTSPAIMMAYDLLELNGIDIRSRTQIERRSNLEGLLTTCVIDKIASQAKPNATIIDHQNTLQLSPVLMMDQWDQLSLARTESRSRGVEGLMLKAKTAEYGVGRTKAQGQWWKWKIAPYTVDAVLIYAQRGHGRRANLYSDYTFAVWNLSVEEAKQKKCERVLVPFTKAYSGLTDIEIHRVDAIVRKTTKETFGPVRSVEPSLLFELAFEAIALSPRHKSGIAVRFPRILRWRLDKPLAEADTLENLQCLLSHH